MNGMKEGAGEDPFADDDESDQEATTESSEPTRSERRSSRDRSTESRSSSSSSSSRSEPQQMQIPYIYRRDGVHDGRDRYPLFLKDKTKSAEREALGEMEHRFDADVALTDLREALLMVGLEHLDEVEDQLAEWGYGMSFEE